MTTEQAKDIIQILTKKGIVFEKGLSNDEVTQVEKAFNLNFPPDLKLFLQTALPISNRFVNWRIGLKSKEEANKILDCLNWPLEGMLFDLEANNFWIESWGTCPINHEDKVFIAKRHYETYPKLIPIYSHRYIPSQPHETGNPVFSVHQMDIIYYGIDLYSYFANEFSFNESGAYELDEYPNRKIEFWSLMAEDDDPYNK